MLQDQQARLQRIVRLNKRTLRLQVVVIILQLANLAILLHRTLSN